MDLAVENWTIQELTGYVPKTTFYTDFSIADKFVLRNFFDSVIRLYCSK